MKCIANLIFPDSGEINIAGFNLSQSRNQALSHLSAMIEAPGLYYNLSGLDNLHLFAGLRGISKKRVDEVIEFTGLSGALKKRASAYSMGMKQRLALGIAILTKPTVLILDEPFSGLDPHGASELRNLIKGLAAEGCGILFSSHEILEVEKTAQRNIFIKNGRVIIPERSKTRGSMQRYKLYLEPNGQVLPLLIKLTESALLEDFQQDEDTVIITLTSPKHLSSVLKALLGNGQKIAGIIPLTSDIENLYNNIYQRDAL
jgi:ABC-2 type transport system ATP-binding protein